MKRIIAGSRSLVLVAALAVIAAMCTVSTAHAASTTAGIRAVAFHATAATSAPCVFNPATACQSTDPTVTLNIYYYGDSSACTFVWDVDWGDGNSSSNLTVTDPPNGHVFLQNHTYTASRTFTISVTGQVTSGDCVANPFTVQFTLQTPPPTLYTSHVRVFGLVACTDQNRPLPLPGPRYEASRVRFQAANGEAHDAKISGFSYHVDFKRVPASGERVFVYVTCKLDTNPSWGTSFRLTRHLLQLQYLNLIRL